MLRINNKEKQRILEIHRNNSMKPWLYKLLNEKWEVTDDPGSEFEMNPAGPVPFKNQAEGDAFRKWVHTNYPQIAEEEKLSLSYPEYNNKYIKNVWNRLELKSRKYLGQLYKEYKKKTTIVFPQNNQMTLQANTTSDLTTLKNPYINQEDFYEKQDVLVPQLDKKKEEYLAYVRLLEHKRPEMENILKRAQTWWTNWLNNPQTKGKFQKLHNLLPDKTENIYKKYFEVLKNLYLNFFYEDSATQAFVIPSRDIERINLNAKFWQITDEEWLRVIVHEIQHLLFFVYPLSPNKSITEFKSSDDCYIQNSEIYNNTQLSYEDKIKLLTNDNIQKISQDLNINEQYVPWHITPFIQYAYKGWKEGYLRGDPSELSSRITATRLFFLGEDNENTDLTKKQFVDYIINHRNNGANNSDQVDYVICHWVLRGFEPMENFVNYLNTKFVKTDKIDQKSSPLDLPYKPKTNYV